jgi:hypothetical protein
MATDTTQLTYEPLTLRSHVATAMFAMALVFGSGTLLAWVLAGGGCDSYGCASLPPAVTVLVVLGATTSAALLVGSLLLWAPLKHDVGPKAARNRPPGSAW